MNILKRVTAIVLAVCMAIMVMFIPDIHAFAKASVSTKNIEINVNSSYSTGIVIVYSKGDAKIKNIKTNNKNLIARQTYQIYHREAQSYSKYPYGYAEINMYAKKKGKYILTFDVCDEKGKKLSSHKVKVTAREPVSKPYVSPIKQVTFNGKNHVFYTLTTQKSGRFKVQMNKGYKLKSITMSCYDKKGKLVDKKIKNNANVTIGQYAYISESKYENEGNVQSPGDWSYQYYSNLFAETRFTVEYQNIKTKTTGTASYTMYRIPKN